MKTKKLVITQESLLKEDLETKEKWSSYLIRWI